MKIYDRVLEGQPNNNVALTTLQDSFTAGELRETVSKYESMLSPLNIAGKRVALLVPAMQEYFPLFLAVNKLEGVVTPFSWQFRQTDLIHVLDFLNPHIVFTVNEHTGFNFAETIKDWARSKGEDTLVYTSVDCISWQTNDYKGSPKELETTVKGVICFTSGSTGTPKGMVFHEDILDSSYKRLVEAIDLRRTDHVLVYSSPSTLFGMMAMNVVINSGANLIVPNEFDLQRILSVMKKWNCNKVVTTPSVFKTLYTFASKLNPEVLKYLELVCFVGEKIPDYMVGAFPLLNHCTFISHFGSSESGAVGNVYLTKDSKDLEYTVANEAQAKSVDGELYVKSGTLFTEYYRNPQLTQEVFNDGWFKMGDLVEFLEERTFKIIGRKKDIIKKGGQQADSSEIEQVINTINGVQNVAVVGSPHPVYGEQIVAFLVAEGLTASDIRTYCSRKISAYKVPDKILFIDEMPLNQGKMDKLKLKSMLN